MEIFTLECMVGVLNCIGYGYGGVYSGVYVGGRLSTWDRLWRVVRETA